MKKHCGQKNWRKVIPVKFWYTSLRFWFFFSYLITTVSLKKLKIHYRMEFRKNEWRGKIIRWNFWLQLFLSHKPWFDCRYHAGLYNNEIESPTFIIKFFHAYNCLSFSTDFPLYNPISKKKRLSKLCFTFY